jgi:hypothetical protein
MATIHQYQESVHIVEIHPEGSDTLESCVAAAQQLIPALLADGFRSVVIELHEDYEDDEKWVTLRAFSKVVSDDCAGSSD